VSLDRSGSFARSAEGLVRDYFFAANGYEEGDMDFYAAEGISSRHCPSQNG